MIISPSDRTTKHLTRLTNYISQVIANPALLGTLSRKRAKGKLLQPIPLLASHADEEWRNSHKQPPHPLAGEGWGEGQ